MAMNKKEKGILAELIDGIINHRFDNSNPYCHDEITDAIALLGNGDKYSDGYKKCLPKVRGWERREVRYGIINKRVKEAKEKIKVEEQS